MKTTNHFRIFAFLLIGAMSCMGLYAIERLTSVPDYSQFTYQWTDAQGMVQTSLLSQPAEDPEQIMAFVRAVYEEKQLPGTYYRDGSRRQDTFTVNNKTQDNTVDYRTVTNKGGWEAQGITPLNDGVTAILVELNDDWDLDNYTAGRFNHETAGRDYGRNSDGSLRADREDYRLVSEAYKRVSLITNQRYFTDSQSENGAGFLLHVHADLNRFFIMTKGSAMQEKENNNSFTYSRFPYGTFEEISPSATSGNETIVPGVYGKLHLGESFPIKHICPSALEKKHWMAMNGVDGRDLYPVELMLFLPDSRSLDMYSSSNNKYPYNNYNDGHQPQMLDQTIHLSLSTKKNADWSLQNPLADVTLTWTDAVRSVMGLEVPTRYYIFEVINGIKSLESVGYVDNDMTYTLTRRQETESQNIQYVVEAVAINGPYSAIDSNIASGVIPGMDEMEKLELTISGNSTGDFIFEQDENRYTQVISMRTSQFYPILNGYLNRGLNEFKLMRGDKHVASVIINRKNYVENTSGWSATRTYSFTYKVINADNKEIVKETEFDSFTLTRNWWQWPDEPTDHILTLENIEIPDLFTTPTSGQDAHDTYTYTMSYGQYKSNTLVFRTFSGSLEVDFDRLYTLEQINAEPDSHDDNSALLIPAQGLKVKVRVDNSPVILWWDIRDHRQRTIARIFRETEGFSLLKQDAQGDITVRDNSAVTINDPASGQTWLEFTYQPTDLTTNELHVVVVTARADSDTYNTYGTLRQAVPLFPQTGFTMGEPYVDVENAFRRNDRFHVIVATDLHWSPELPEGQTVEHANIWRRVRDARGDSGYALVLAASQPVEGEDVPELGGDTTPELNSNGTSLVDNIVTPVTQPLNVRMDYRLRLYIDTRADSEADPSEPRYLILDRNVWASPTTPPNLPTGIDSILGDDPNAPAQYFDLQGRPVESATPGQVTIRVTPDGATKTVN